MHIIKLKIYLFTLLQYLSHPCHQSFQRARGCVTISDILCGGTVTEWWCWLYCDYLDNWNLWLAFSGVFYMILFLPFYEITFQIFRLRNIGVSTTTKNEGRPLVTYLNNHNHVYRAAPGYHSWAGSTI